MQSPRQELKLVAAEAKRRQVLAERAAGARCRSVKWVAPNYVPIFAYVWFLLPSGQFI